MSEHQNEHNRNSQSGAGYINLGAGRITEITSAAVALNMLDRITAVMGSLPNLKKEQIQDLAAYIELLDAKRFLDTREGRITVMDSLCSWLLENNIIDNPSARLTMELLDQWDYAFKQYRSKGMDFRVYSNIYYSRSEEIANDSSRYIYSGNYPGSNSKNEATIKDIDVNTFLGGMFEYSKPLGRFIQSSISGQIRGGLTKSYSKGQFDTVYSSEICSYPEANVNANASISWYPSTRTTFSVNSVLIFPISSGILFPILGKKTTSLGVPTPASSGSSDGKILLSAHRLVNDAAIGPVWR